MEFELQLDFLVQLGPINYLFQGFPNLIQLIDFIKKLIFKLI